MAARNRITVDTLLSDLQEDRDLARRLNQPAAAISATMAKARLVGLLVDRKETGAPGEFADLPNEAAVIDRVRAELGEEAAQQLAKALKRADKAGLDRPAVDVPQTRKSDQVYPPRL